MLGADDNAIWGGQHLFRLQVEMEVRRALELAGAPMEVLVQLVAFPTDRADQPVVDPPIGALRSADLAAVPETLERHRDAVAHDRDLPWRTNPFGVATEDLITRRARARALAVAANDADPTVTWFASDSVPVAGYDVHTAVGLRTEVLRGVPSIRGTSLVREVVVETLRRADVSLRQPDGGADRAVFLASVGEVVRMAARRLLDAAVDLGRPVPGDLYDALNEVSTLAYERRAAVGRAVFPVADVEPRVALSDPVEPRNARAARKLLEITDDDFPLVVRDGRVIGFGLTAPTDDLVDVVFPDRATWELRAGDRSLLRVAYGTPTLARPLIDRLRFDDSVQRTLGDVPTSPLWDVVTAVSAAEHGTTVVFSADATAESDRLAGQATRLTPTAVDGDDLLRLAAVDGALLLDLDARLHAVGVILDGTAVAAGSAARGARFNSAVRYQAAADPATLVVVVSEDGTVDIVPHLEPQISRQVITDAMDELRAAVPDGAFERFARAHNRIHELAFYLDAAECAEANDLFAAQLRRRFGSGQRPGRNPMLAPNPAMSEDYFLD